jgi:VanZ family protein
MLAKLQANRYLCYWLPVLLWMGLMFFFSSQPQLPLVVNKTVDLVTKKAGHVTEYGVLAFLLWRAISKERGWAALPSFGGAFVLSLLYAASDELHQTFVSGRSGRLTDVGFDALGAILALGLVWWFSNRRWARVSGLVPSSSVRDRGGDFPRDQRGQNDDFSKQAILLNLDAFQLDQLQNSHQSDDDLQT